MSLTKIQIDKLKPLFARDVDSEGLEEIAQSIRFAGILEPLVVRAKDYGIIAGYRRYLAAKKAGLTEVPCVLVDCDDAEAFRLSLIENIQRENLSDYEMAKRLGEFREKTKFTEEQIGQLIGKSRFWVSNHLRMLELETMFSRENMERLTEHHARAILTQPEEIRDALVDEVQTAIAEKGELPSVREIERKAKELLKPSEVLTEEGASEMVELKTPEDVDRFFDEILKTSEVAEETTHECPCGCGWTLSINWSKREVEWVAP